jgi:hypothetical protein
MEQKGSSPCLQQIAAGPDPYFEPNKSNAHHILYL